MALGIKRSSMGSSVISESMRAISKLYPDARITIIVREPDSKDSKFLTNDHYRDIVAALSVLKEEEDRVNASL